MAVMRMIGGLCLLALTLAGGIGPEAFGVFQKRLQEQS